MSLREQILAAARAESIPAGRSGIWTITKHPIAHGLKNVPLPGEPGRTFDLPAGTYTHLWCMTTEKAHHGYGDLVMEDKPPELATHLDFMLRARGRVLITGLGLGCVARGALANPAVESVTIIERDSHVLRLVAPHMPSERCRIVHADAVKWCQTNTAPFDCAWHDLWSNPDQDEPHLQVTHGQLLCAMHNRVSRFQGAWAMPRDQRRLYRRFIPVL